MIPGLAQWVENLALPQKCSKDYRCGSDPVLLWPWCRLAVAALVLPLAWKLPYVASTAVKRKEKKQEEILEDI